MPPLIQKIDNVKISQIKQTNLMSPIKDQEMNRIKNGFGNTNQFETSGQKSDLVYFNQNNLSIFQKRQSITTQLV